MVSQKNNKHINKDTKKSQASELVFRSLFDNAGYAIGHHHQNKLIQVNKACLELFGFENEEDVIGKNVIEFIAPKEKERIKEISINRSKGMPAPFFYETQGLKKDGSIFDMDVKVSTYKLGEEVYTIVIMRDISDRKRIEKELETYRENLELLVEQRTLELQNLNEDLEAFSYSISHDLRAPIRSISGFSKIILEEKYKILDEESIDYLNRIEKAAQKMDSMVIALLELSRISRNEIQLVDINLSEIVNDIVSDFSLRDLDRQIKYIVEENIHAQGDPKLIGIVLQNLIDNARKFSKDQDAPQIEFSSRVDEAQQIFVVRDNGIGFDNARSENIFTIFQRLHSGSDFGGYGIGLATSKKIIQRHGGEIWAEGEIGKGATFYFTLPEPQIEPPKN